MTAIREPIRSETQAQPAGHGLYVFCVTSDGVSLPTDGGQAEDSTLFPCRLAVVEPGLAAVVCDVDLDDWLGESGERHLQDLQWLGPRAVRHERVIEEVMASGPVLPLRFGCIFSGELSLKRWLSHNSQRIAAHIAAIGERREWSVKGWLDSGRAASALAKSEAAADSLPTSPGARYLQEQRLKQKLSRAARDWGRSAGSDVLAALRPFYERQKTLGALPGSASARDEEVAFHHALLVAPADLDDLRKGIEQLNQELSPRGLEVALTGPWPPYSFCPELVDPSSAVTAFDASGN